MFGGKNFISTISLSIILVLGFRKQSDFTSDPSSFSSGLFSVLFVYHLNRDQYLFFDRILRYDALAPLYYLGAAVAVIVYDITSPESFNKAQYWVKEISGINMGSNYGYHITRAREEQSLAKWASSRVHDYEEQQCQKSWKHWFI